MKDGSIKNKNDKVLCTKCTPPAYENAAQIKREDGMTLKLDEDSGFFAWEATGFPQSHYWEISLLDSNGFFTLTHTSKKLLFGCAGNPLTNGEVPIESKLAIHNTSLTIYIAINLV